MMPFGSGGLRPRGLHLHVSKSGGRSTPVWSGTDVLLHPGIQPHDRRPHSHVSVVRAVVGDAARVCQ